MRPQPRHDTALPGLILIIEDEPGIVDFVERGLRGHGFDVTTAGDGLRGTELALSEEVDLVVLDMMLPGRSGLEVLAHVHAARPQLPVIVLTARGEVDHRVAGLDAGAVDYLVKPFSLNELAARVRAQLRAVAQSPSTKLRAAYVEVDLLTREVRAAGELVRLSSTEYELLVCLVQNSGQLLTREYLLREVWGYEHDPSTNIVDVYIGYLRRKLRRPGRDAPIATVRSRGYRFDDRA